MKNTTLKKMLCILMAVMLLLPAMASIAFAETDEVIYEITKHPTPASPTVEVSVEEGTSYQWYEAETEYVEITDESSVSILDGVTYGEDGWTGIQMPQGKLYFGIELQAGDSIVVESSTGATAQDFFLMSNSSSLAVQAVEGSVIRITVEHDDLYFLLSASGKDVGAVRAYEETLTEPQLMEGQTSKTLTEYKIGNYYTAVVTFENGDAFETEAFEMIYAITSNPTTKNPSVGTNVDSDVEEYRWYFVEKDGIEYLVIGDELYIKPQIYEGEHKDGLWYGEDDYINLAVSAVAGDVLKVKVPNGFQGYVGLYNGYDAFETDEDGIYSYKSFEYEEVDFEVDSDGKLDGVEIWIEREDKIYPVSYPIYINDVTMEIMPEYVYGSYDGERWSGWYGEFVCSFDIDRDGTILELVAPYDVEITLEYEDEIRISPEENNGIYSFTLDKGSYDLVLLSYDGVLEFEMRLIDGEKVYSFVDKFNPFDEENKTVKANEVNEGYFDDGLWYSDGEYNEINLELEISEGYILTVIPSESFDGTATLYNGLEIELVKENGKYIFVADKHYKLCLELEGCENEFSAQITLQKGFVTQVSGEAQSEMKPSLKGFYFAEVEFKDGTVNSSLAFESFNCDHNEAVLDCEKSVGCVMCDEMLEPQGHNYSEWKTTKSSTSKEKGEEKRICSHCGKTETREIDMIMTKSDGAGIGIVFIIIGCGAGASAIAIAAAWIVSKKKSLRV